MLNYQTFSRSKQFPYGLKNVLRNNTDFFIGKRLRCTEDRIICSDSLTHSLSLSLSLLRTLFRKILQNYPKFTVDLNSRTIG